MKIEKDLRIIEVSNKNGKSVPIRVDEALLSESLPRQSTAAKPAHDVFRDRRPRGSGIEPLYARVAAILHSITVPPPARLRAA
jgi:hypothetical protein